MFSYCFKYPIGLNTRYKNSQGSGHSMGGCLCKEPRGLGAHLAGTKSTSFDCLNGVQLGFHLGSQVQTQMNWSKEVTLV